MLPRSSSCIASPLAPCAQVWVYGNSFKSQLVAVVVPKEDALKDWAAANGKSGERTARTVALCHCARVVLRCCF